MSTTIPNLVSAVIPVFNRPRLIAEAVECVLAQTYRPIEVIIVDDGSTDDTLQVAQGLAGKYRDVIRVTSIENRGPGGAREAGRALACGEFIQYLDSDDWLAPRKFELQVATLCANPAAEIAYCKTRVYSMGEPPADVPAARTGERLDYLFPELFSGRFWHTMTPLFRRSLTDRMGPWSLLRQEEDVEYDARAGSYRARLAYCPEFLADARHHQGNRASGSWERDPVRMGWRCEAHKLILMHGQRAGVEKGDPHLKRFSRELFHICRLAGEAGLCEKSAEMLELALEASGMDPAESRDLKTYRILGRVFGFCLVGRITCVLDRRQFLRKPSIGIA